MKLHQLTPTLTIDQALRHFDLHQRTSRHTKKTLDYYSYSFGKFTAWLAAQGIDNLEQVSPGCLRHFMLELSDTLKPSSVHGIMRAVRALYTFLELEEHIDTNPMRKVKMPKLDKHIMPAFTEEEIDKLMAATSGKDVLSIRNRALVLFLLDSGLRLEECASLTLADVSLQSGLVKVMGKGRKERISKLGHQALRALLKYVGHLGTDTPTTPLWVGVRGPLTYFGLSEVIQKIGELASVHAHPHKFRRSCALMMLRNGADIFSVQQMLGHADLDVMRQYLAQTQADISNAHVKFSPVDNVRLKGKAQKQAQQVPSLRLRH